MASFRSRLPRVPRRWTLLAEDDLRDRAIRISAAAMLLAVVAARVWPGAISRFILLWSTPFLFAVVGQRLGACRVRPGAAVWMAQGDRAGSIGFYLAIIGGQLLTLAIFAAFFAICMGFGLPADTADPAVRAYHAAVLTGGFFAFSLGAAVPGRSFLGWAAPFGPLASFYAMSILEPRNAAMPEMAGRILLIWGLLSLLIAIAAFRRRLAV